MSGQLYTRSEYKMKNYALPPVTTSVDCSCYLFQDKDKVIYTLQEQEAIEIRIFE